MELGLYTFADVDPNAPDKGAAAAKRAEELIAEIELADQVGLDVFGSASIIGRITWRPARRRCWRLRR